jgi:hypothetical protein
MDKCGDYDDDDFSAYDMCCLCGGGSGTSECTDFNPSDVWDAYSFSCSPYAADTSLCSGVDVNAFVAMGLCCECGGGLYDESGQCTDFDPTNFWDPDSFSCDSYSDTSTCGDTDDFNSIIALGMCCSCGGGSTLWENDYSDYCSDVSNSGDIQGNDCTYYFSDPTSCGIFDDETFTASEVCCSCGGGVVNYDGSSEFSTGPGHDESGNVIGSWYSYDASDESGYWLTSDSSNGGTW